MQNITLDVIFLKAEKFDFIGTKGDKIIAFNCRFLHGGSVYKAKIDEKQYEELKEVVQQEARLVLSLRSQKEVLSLVLVEVL